METITEKAIQLKQLLLGFVYEAEGEVAVALETYAAEQSKKNNYGIQQQNLIIDTFLTAGKIGEKTPLDIFLTEDSNLNKSDRSLLKSWRKNFTGLFEVKQIQDNSFRLMNWLTAKEYLVLPHSQISIKEISRWQPGEIILTRIAPINEQEWFFFSDCITKGKLSKPKLAVAIGEFKKNYPHNLYDDAPELLEKSWDSVAQYHQEFVEFMGSDRLTLPGYQLNQKLVELQKIMKEKRLAASGIDDSKSVSEILQASGADETEISEAAAELGADAQAVAKLIKSKEKLSMVIPEVELPPEIKQAELVTVFSHPRWGQIFVPTYSKFTSFLATDSPESVENSQPFVRKYLEYPQINYYIWQQLKQEYPQSLEKVLQTFLQQTDFNLETNLDTILLQYDKSPKPELPEIASVPIHLHNLFQEALAQVQKSKSKSKKKQKSKGFK
jgi:hypothetical protein